MLLPPAACCPALRDVRLRCHHRYAQESGPRTGAWLHPADFCRLERGAEFTARHCGLLRIDSGVHAQSVFAVALLPNCRVPLRQGYLRGRLQRNGWRWSPAPAEGEEHVRTLGMCAAGRCGVVKLSNADACLSRLVLRRR